MSNLTNLLLIIIILNVCKYDIITFIILAVSLLLTLVHLIVDIVDNVRDIKKE